MNKNIGTDPDTEETEQLEKKEEESRDSPPDIKPQEKKEILRRGAPRAAVVYETIRLEGEDELLRPPRALAWSGLAAGLSMGFSMVAQGLLREGLPDAPWAHLITSFGYSIGFLIVILGRQQLFTENTLTPILQLLARRDLETLGKVSRLWAVVLCSNLLGALLFAWVVAKTQAFSPEMRLIFRDLSIEATSGSFGEIFIKAVFAGWLIALMVWLLPFAETARVTVIILITYLVGVAHLAHSIAGAVEAFYIAVRADITFFQALSGFLLPTILGNIVGGVTLVAVINYAQVFSGSSSDGFDA